jgi:hypothetical protein
MGDVAVDARFSNIEGGWEGEGNINTDPLIVFNEGAIIFDSESPCIDTGSDALLPIDALDIDDDGDLLEPLPLDFFGELRIGGASVDIGSIEYHSQSCFGDLDGDGNVNVSDLLNIIAQWGLTDSPADVNSDGIVNVSDLLLVVGAWGPCE